MGDCVSPLAVYIHFPYCKSRCPYCDFFRALKPRELDETRVIEQYRRDIVRFSELLGKRQVKSVFFGGGTPSILSSEAIGKTLDFLADCFDILPHAEISLEANPNTFDYQKFLAFHQVGINRLSLGVQALNQNDLKFLGRTHSVNEALQAMALAAQTFEKFSIDLIYARPQQIWEDWVKEIDLALSFGLKHISLYQLTLEENTIFARRGVQLPDEDIAAQLYTQTVNYLGVKGMERYEVSNFAVNREQQSVHNLVYWQGGDYIGIGEGAHGRFIYHGKVTASIDGDIAEQLSAEERAEELLFMGLRIREGINDQRFFAACGLQLFEFVNNLAIKRLAELKLLCYDSHNIWLTDDGFLLLDRIVLELVSHNRQ
ncbi:radical SAM family heme chaperone HemW [bacterium]|nr:radical SAM family heme chaperone HemW [bacterium]